MHFYPLLNPAFFFFFFFTLADLLLESNHVEENCCFLVIYSGHQNILVYIFLRTQIGEDEDGDRYQGNGNTSKNPK